MQTKKYLLAYTLIIFGLFVSLAEATSPAVIDAHIAAPIQEKAQRLFYHSTGELTAEQYAHTLSGVIDDEKDSKLGNLVRLHSAHWLSGRYGFNTKNGRCINYGCLCLSWR